LPGSDETDLALLRAAALACGPLLRNTFQTEVKTWSKGAAGPVTEVDLAVNALLKDHLRAARPGYGWLSEESADEPARVDRDRVFIVDPIDGTKAFIEGTPDFCVALAIVSNGRPVAAAIYNPITEEMFEARAGAGAYRNGVRTKVTDAGVLENARMLGRPAWFKNPRWPRPWPEMQVEHRNAIQYRLALVTSGAFDAMLSLGPKHDWDVAAGALMVEEAGGRATDPWGEALVFNKPEARTPGLVAAGPGLHPLLIERVRFMARPAPAAPSPGAEGG
jgi:myo-inositol-1(or 4)-monophosphatase